MPRAFIAGWMGSRASRVPAWRRGGAALSAVLLAGACACGLAGCRYTDFFTQEVIDQRAENESESVDPIVINSLTATEESDEHSARKWSDTAKQTSNKENLVVYGKKPNTELSAPHSVFSTSLHVFEGLDASDPVKLVYSSDADVDHEVEVKESDEEAEKETESRSSSNEKSEDEEEKASSKTSEDSKEESSDSSSSKKQSESEETSGGGSKDEKSAGDASRGAQESDGGSGSEGGSGGDSGDNDDGEGTGDEGDSGTDEAEDGAGDSDDPEAPEVYDPSKNSRQRVHKVNSVAAIGQAAVVAQAIGGKGAICAMDSETYYGLDGTSDAFYASSFGDVFADELEAGFEEDCLLWSGDGTSPDDVIDIDALIEACGENGVIVYDQSVADADERFSAAQQTKIAKKGIQLVPVDLRTVQGMLDAATVIGDALSESEVLAKYGWDSQDMAQQYSDAVESIVEGVMGTHGGKLASGDDLSYKSVATTYNSFNASWGQYYVCGVIATDFATGCVDTTQSDKTNPKDTSSGILFTYLYSGASPQKFWMQVAGVLPTTATTYFETVNTRSNPNDSITSLMLLDVGTGTTRNLSKWSYPADSPFTRLSAWVEDGGGSYCQYARAFDNVDYSSTPGGPFFPYLIVTSSSNGMTADEVKEAVTSSIKSSDGVYSVVGSYSRNTQYKNESHNAFTYDGLSKDDVVIANPCGLLGSWTDTENSMESVLESVWIAHVYSKTPDNSPYDSSSIYGSDGISDLKVKIGGRTCTTLEECVEAFYETFYRYGFGDNGTRTGYSDVVTDEGV